MNTKKKVIAGAILLIAFIVTSGCSVGQGNQPEIETAPQTETAPEITADNTRAEPPSYLLPTEDGGVIPPATQSGRKPSKMGEVTIRRNIGTFEFDPVKIETVRPDIFQPGHFSLFDILVHLDMRGEIDLEYHFDESMDTHVIDSLNGETGWWHDAFYSSGWSETNVFRMDMYPYKDGTTFRLIDRNPAEIEDIYQTFREEVARLEMNNGKVIIPQVTIRSRVFTLEFQDVLVRAHGIRSDVLKPDVITAMDILLSLLEQGELSRLKLTWYEGIADADPVDSYWTEQINEAEAYGGAGFVYETGPLAFKGFRGSHIHIPSDVRAIVSPEYAFWWWINLTRILP